MFKNCHAQGLIAANCGVRLNHSKVVDNTNSIGSLIFVDNNEVKNNLCSNIAKAKSVYVRHR